MNGTEESPLTALVVGVVMLALGIGMFVWRNEVGSWTGYWVRFHRVDKPTPGCMLIPFAIVLALLGVAMLVISIKELIFG